VHAVLAESVASMVQHLTRRAFSWASPHGAPDSAPFWQLARLAAVVNDHPDAPGTAEYWAATPTPDTLHAPHLRHFLRTASEAAREDSLSSLVLLLSALANSEANATECYAFLAEGVGAASLSSFFAILQSIFSDASAPASQDPTRPSTSDDFSLSPDDVNGICLILRLLRRMVALSPALRRLLLVVGDTPTFDLLFGLLQCAIPYELKTSIAQVLAAFALDSSTCTRLWSSLWQSGILQLDVADSTTGSSTGGSGSGSSSDNRGSSKQADGRGGGASAGASLSLFSTASAYLFSPSSGALGHSATPSFDPRTRSSGLYQEFCGEEQARGRYGFSRAMLTILARISDAGGDEVAAASRAADEAGDTWPIAGSFADALVLVKQVYLPVVNKLSFASAAERWRLLGALFRVINVNMYRATGATADRAMRTVLASNERGWGLPALVGTVIDGAAVMADECRPEAQEAATGRTAGVTTTNGVDGPVGTEPADDAVDVREVDEWWARDEAFDSANDPGWTVHVHPAPPAGTWWARHPHTWTAYLDTVSLALSVLEIAAAREDEFLAQWRIARRPPAGVARLGALVVSASAAHVSPYALVVALAALVDPVWPANVAGRSVRLLAVLDRPPRAPVAAGVPAALEGVRAVGKLQRACRQWLVSPSSVAVYESGEVYLDVRVEVVSVLAEGSRRPSSPMSLSHALRRDALDPVLRLLRASDTDADLRAGCAEFLAACVTDARSWRKTLEHLRLREEQEETLLLHRVVAQEHGGSEEAWLRTVAAVLRVAAADAVLAHEEAQGARGSSTRGETKGLAAANARIARLCSLVTGRPALMPTIFAMVLDSIRQPNAEHEYAFADGDEVPSPATGVSVRAAADALRTSHAAQMTQDQLVAQIDWSACTLVAGSPFLPASLARQVHVFDVPLLHDQLRRRVAVLREEAAVPQPELLDALVVLCLRRATARNAHALLLAAQRSCMSQWVQAVWALSEPAPRPLTASLGAGDMYDDAGEERLAAHLLDYLQAIVSALADPAIEMSEVEDGQEAEHPLDVAARAAGLLIERIVGLQEVRRARHAARPGCQEDEVLPLPTAVLSSVFRGLAEAAARGATLTRRALCAAALLSHTRLLRTLSTTMLHTNIAAAVSTSWGAKLIDTLAADVASVVGTGADWRAVGVDCCVARRDWHRCPHFRHGACLCSGDQAGARWHATAGRARRISLAHLRADRRAGGRARRWHRGQTPRGRRTLGRLSSGRPSAGTRVAVVGTRRTRAYRGRCV